jgi:hypothetical protein
MAKQIKTTKDIQKQNIIDIMQSDEQLNMYDETLDQSTTQNKVDNIPDNIIAITPDIKQSTHSIDNNKNYQHASMGNK